MASVDSPPGRPIRPCWRRFLGAVAGTLAIAACDIPTDLPIVDTQWRVNAEDTRFGVAELLPGDVRLTVDSSAFLVDFDPVTFSESLETLCPECAAADGLTVPKPPFIGTFTSSIDFPPEVKAVTVLDGEVVLDVHNGLNFDPLRPASGSYGSLTITITDDADGDVLGTLTIEGSTTSLPPDDTLTRTLPLSGATINGSLRATTTVYSPLGDPVTLDSSLEVAVTATPVNVRVADVTVEVASRQVDLVPVSLDVAGVDESLAGNVREGSFILGVTNPFGIRATFEIEITGTNVATIQKSAAIGPEPTSTVEIDFTGEELQSFLGHTDVQLTGSGVVDPAAPTITVLPGQELVLSAELGLTIRLGD